MLNCIILDAALSGNFDGLDFWLAVSLRVQHRRFGGNTQLDGFADFVDESRNSRNYGLVILLAG